MVESELAERLPLLEAVDSVCSADELTVDERLTSSFEFSSTEKEQLEQWPFASNRHEHHEQKVAVTLGEEEALG